MTEVIYGIIYLLAGIAFMPPIKTPTDLASIICLSVGGAFLLVGIAEVLRYKHDR